MIHEFQYEGIVGRVYCHACDAEVVGLDGESEMDDWAQYHILAYHTTGDCPGCGADMPVGGCLRASWLQGHECEVVPE